MIGMKQSFSSLLALGALLASSAAAGAQGVPRPVDPGHGGHQHGAPVRDTAFTEADVRFMTGMIPHHTQAIEMSRLAPERAGRASIRTLAERIINAQVDEIAAMQQWLRDRGRPVPEAHAHGGDHAGHHLMPGMLTPEQMRELEAARGARFDELFLTYMIQHHRGAVGMVGELLGSEGSAHDLLVFKIASDINVDQLTEIARMQRMLADVIFETSSS
jgi:uncharacterized protein (DUF305 family)